MIRVIFLKKEISKNLKIARGNLQLISHPRKSVSGTTVILGSLHPKTRRHPDYNIYSLQLQLDLYRFHFFMEGFKMNYRNLSYIFLAET